MRIFEDYIDDLEQDEISVSEPTVEENWEYVVSVERPGKFKTDNQALAFCKQLDRIAHAYPEIEEFKSGIYSTHSVSMQEFHRANPNFDDICLLFNGRFKSAKRAISFIENICCTFAKLKKYNVIFFEGKFYKGQKFDLVQNDFIQMIHNGTPAAIAEKSQLRTYIRVCGIVSLLCQEDHREAVARSFGYIDRINHLAAQFWGRSSIYNVPTDYSKQIDIPELEGKTFNTREYKKSENAQPEYLLIRSDRAPEASRKLYPDFTKWFIKVNGYSPQKYIMEEAVYKIDVGLAKAVIQKPQLYLTVYSNKSFKICFSCYIGEIQSSEFKWYLLFATLRVSGNRNNKDGGISDLVDSIDRISGGALNKNALINEINNTLKGRI